MITAEFKPDVVNLQVSNLYQWDSNQQLKITGIDFTQRPIEVHFCNKKSTSALVAMPTTLSGDVIVNIPNELLSEPYDIVAYVYQTNGSARCTTKTIKIPIVARQKPANYAYTGGNSSGSSNSGSGIDLSSATATSADILNGKIAFTASGRTTGTHVCPSIGASQTKTVTPTKAVQTVVADSGYYLSSVNVNPIPSEYSKITTSFDATTGTLTITEV